MIMQLTAIGVAVCRSLTTPCTTSAGINVALRPLVNDGSADWSRRYDTAQFIRNDKPYIAVDGQECDKIATFTQANGISGDLFLCRVPRQ